MIQILHFYKRDLIENLGGYFCHKGWLPFVPMEHNFSCYPNLSPRLRPFFAEINAFYFLLQSKINFGLQKSPNDSNASLRNTCQRVIFILVISIIRNQCLGPLFQCCITSMRGSCAICKQPKIFFLQTNISFSFCH